MQTHQKLLNSINQFTAALSTYLFIERCRICDVFIHSDSANAAICRRCLSRLVQEPIVSEFPIDDQNLLQVTSATTYDARMKTLIYKLKYDGDQLIARDLATLMKPALTQIIAAHNTGTNDSENRNRLVLLPIPLSRWRSMQRGFNQSTIIAKELGSTFGLQTNNRFLKRPKHTKPQHDLRKSDRNSNLIDAFACSNKRKESPSRDDSLILLDDICTSGATLVEAAKALRHYGFKNIQAVTASRALLDLDKSKGLTRLHPGGRFVDSSNKPLLRHNIS